MVSHHLIRCPLAITATPAKSAGQLNRAALGGLGLKGLPLKPDVMKAAKLASVAAGLDDSVETKRKLEKMDLPEVDMTMADGEAGVGDLEGGDDDDEDDANKMDQDKANDAMDEDEDENEDENADVGLA